MNPADFSWEKKGKTDCRELVDMNNSSAMATVPSASEEASVSSAGNPMIAAQVGPVKKKRNLPGMPGSCS